MPPRRRLRRGGGLAVLVETIRSGRSGAGHITLITIDQPERMNAIERRHLARADQTLGGTFQRDGAARSQMIAGAGKVPPSAPGPTPTRPAAARLSDVGDEEPLRAMERRRRSRPSNHGERDSG